MLNADNAQKPVRLIKRTEKYKGHVITVYEDHVDVGGHDTYWDYIHHNGAAAVLPVTDDGELLLVRQYRHALGRYTLEIPAGKRDGDEDFLVCAIRELKEETGCTADHIEKLATAFPSPGYTSEILHLYFAHGLHHGEQHLDIDEDLDAFRIPLDKAVEMVMSGQICDSKTQTLILMVNNIVDKGELK